MTGTRNGETRGLIDTIDIFGGDLARWPDRGLARQAMEGALADRGIRTELDAARSLDRGLAGLRAVLDHEVAASGAAQRTVKAAVAGVMPRPFGRLRWAAVAAVVICAAGLGSVADIGLARDDAPLQMVVVDPLVFGPMAGDDL